jgi:predicted metallo-beta-lactamase superfamily hydrolase
MKILPVAFDSFGVRSMATFVETDDVRIFIDPGVSVSPDRYSLPPHRLELDRRRDMVQAVQHWVAVSDIVIITHYHYDHHNPDDHMLYKNKDIYLKHPREFINYSQKERAEILLGTLEQCAKTVTIADNREFTFGKTRLAFSQPVFHGLSSKLGYVLEVLVDDKDRFVYTSDVQGPLTDEAMSFIIDNDPHTIFLDGPATYLLGSHYKKSDMHRACDNIKKIVQLPSLHTLIIDHHLMRDLRWMDFLASITSPKNKVKICSAAGFCGKREELLEAHRQELYQGVSV